MEVLKKSRSGYSGVITRIYNKLTKIQDNDPNTFDVSNLLRQLDSITASDLSYRKLHDEICESYSEEVDADAEAEALDQHEDSVAKTTSLIERLMAIHDIQASATDLKQRIKAIEQAMESSPDNNFDEDIQVLSQEELQIRSDLRKSTIPSAHHIRDFVNELTPKLMTIKSQRKSISTVSSDSSFTERRHSPSTQVRLPKLTLPTFKGNPIKWASFWARFRSSVHDNSELNDNQKLTYLREAIKDSEVTPLLYRATELDGQYEELVAILKERYDKRRFIHQTHTMAIVNAPAIKQLNYTELCSFIDNLEHSLSSLTDSGQHTIEAVWTSIVTSKLNKRLEEEWLKYSDDTKDVPDIKTLVTFLKKQLNYIPKVSTQPKVEVKNETSVKRQKAPVHSVNPRREVSNTCSLCGGEKHPLYLCPEYKAMTSDKKYTHVQNSKLCFNCLLPGHKTKDCRNTRRCHKCTKMHHTSLHRDTVNQASDSQQAPEAPPADTASVNAFLSPLEPTLQMTSQVILEAPNGKHLRVRALLDTGASISLVAKRVAQQLQLKQDSLKLSIVGAQGAHTGNATSTTTFTIKAARSDSPTLSLTAAVVPKVTCDLPLQGAEGVRNMPHIRGLSFADPQFDQPGRVDLLIGCNLLQDVLLTETRQGDSQQPIARETIFGWVVMGRYSANDEICNSEANVCNVVANSTSDELLRRFWETEEVFASSTYTTEEEEVMKHFNSNTIMLPVGRYQVVLPKKPDAPALGDSRFQAVRRYFANERNLQAKGKLQPFNEVVQEYLDLGHAEAVPSSDVSNPVQSTFYLPMHAVYKDSSSTTKLRVVFDASAKSSSGVSLNDILMVGPTLYPPLTDILIRFRSYKVAISADISKMYRAVELNPEDRDLHRFVWRPNPSCELKDYRMTRVTFGVSASAFAAIKSLQQTAHDHSQAYPIASSHVYKSFYVDDCLAGADTEQEALQLHRQLRSLLLEGGFNLRKWRSSSTKILESIPQELHDQAHTKSLTDERPNESPKALGIHWNSNDDYLYISVGSTNTIEHYTKRQVISDIARLFDILGLFSPATILMKILLQKLWELKLDWDEEIPVNIQQQHSLWRSQLNLLKDVPISRCYFSLDSKVLQTELHGFCDASENAFAAVVYIRAIYADRNPTLTLVAAKTKVSPLKRQSIPRLELCGAQLLAKLLLNVSNALQIGITHCFAWTDSTIVLHWLDGSPRRFKTFVGNRVSYILDRLPANVWRHVPTNSNPADCASRGLLPKDLLEHKLWWNGPKWLLSEPPQLPVQPLTSLNTSTLELKASCNIIAGSTELLENKYSSFTKLIRITAWIRRFKANIQAKKIGRALNLTKTLCIDELKSSEIFLLVRSQERSFSDDLHRFHSGDQLKSTSSLLPLSPMLGSDGLLMVGGRLKNSSLPYSQKHPVILHGKDILTKIIVSSQHITLLHAGPTLMLSVLSSRFHIIGSRRLVRTVYRGCIICKKVAARTESQLMGQLPVHRVTPSPPFAKTGVDFAGPLIIKKGHTRKPVHIKSYVCLFVCLATKAVHLELVSDLTTEAFLASFKRFVSRRGLPTDVFSDNGTNFVGASNELKELYSLLSKDQSQSRISSSLSDLQVAWHFSPERAPHFGGLWEAAVKSTKFHLKRVVGAQRLTFEELTTILSQIEACLNSRPLTSLSNDSERVDVLTPGHFLIGRPLHSLPSRDYSDSKLTTLKRWSLCQSLIQHWWKRWSNEYLQQLQRLQKWRNSSRDFQPDDIVLVKEDSIATTCWPLAKIIDTYPGKDGKTRVVSLKTKNGIYKRPIVKLVLLLPKEASKNT